MSCGICRFCTIGKGTISLFNKRQFNVINAVKIIGGVNVVKGDPYSKWMCSKCYALLWGAVVFRTRAQETNRQLKDQLEINQTVVNTLKKFAIRPEDDDLGLCGLDGPIKTSFQDTVDDILKKYKISDSDKKGAEDFLEITPEVSNKFDTEEAKSEHSNNSSFLDDIPLSEKNNTSTINNSTKHYYKAKCSLTKEKLTCEICLRCINKKYYDGHMAHHKGTRLPDGRMQCKICKKILLHKSFKGHIYLFHDSLTREYICEHCGKVFKYLGSYSYHIAGHNSDYPFKCDQCDYRGATDIHLRSHQRKHNLKEYYHCDICGTKFTMKSNLKRHISRHEGRKIECSKCDRSFYTNREVEKHDQVDHLGMKQFSCDICGKCFGYRSSMMKHQIGVHKRPSLGFGPTPSYLKNQHNTN